MPNIRKDEHNAKDTDKFEKPDSLPIEMVKELLRKEEPRNFVGAAWKNVGSMTAVSVISFCLIYGVFRSSNFFDKMLENHASAIQAVDGVRHEIKQLREEVKLEQRQMRDDIIELRKAFLSFK